MPIRLSGLFGFSGFFGPGTGQITQNSELRTQNSQLRTTSPVSPLPPVMLFSPLALRPVDELVYIHECVCVGYPEGDCQL
jgi:hypothetical protein